MLSGRLRLRLLLGEHDLLLAPGEVVEFDTHVPRPAEVQAPTLITAAKMPSRDVQAVTLQPPHSPRSVHSP